MNWLRDHLDNGTDCLDMGEFSDYRPDGWPLCTNCGKDELQNPRVGILAANAGRAATLADFIQNGLKCLACGWESKTWKGTP